MHFFKDLQLSFLFGTLFSLFLLPTMGQPSTQDSTEEDGGSPIALRADEIAAGAEETTAFLEDATLRSRPRTGIIEIENRLPGTDESTRQLVEKTADELKSQLSLPDLEDLKSGLLRQDIRLRDWRDQIGAESRVLEEVLEEIGKRREVWSQTDNVSRSEDYPEVVNLLIRQTLAAFDQGREEIVERRSHLFTLQISIVALRGLIHESLSAVTVASNVQRRLLFSFDAPPLWDVSQIDAERIWPRFRDQMAKDYNSFKDYASTKTPLIVLSALVWMITVLLLAALRRRLSGGLDDHTHLSAAKQVLAHPSASAIVIVTLVSVLIYPDAPRAWFNVVVLVQMVALLRLLPGFVPGQLLAGSYFVIGLRILVLTNSPIPVGSSLGRILTLLILLLSIFSLFWLKNRVQSVQEVRKRWSTALYLSSWCGTFVLTVALISGILGNLTLAGHLAGGIVKTAFVALSLWVVFSVFLGILVLVLQTETVQKFHFIRSNQDWVFHRTIQLVGALTILLFAVIVPIYFSVSDPLEVALVGIVTTPVTVGALSFSLTDVFMFVFVIWLSFLVSRLICFILDENFLPRITLPRGVSASISRLSYYVILFCGFLIALTAAGFELNRLTILLGAFGIGIGFGLQNIVNNFLSGLILLFERPVQVGDKIQLSGDLMGEVVRIGIRASTIRTFDGAEVLVPNGHLISNELTNWTLSDRKRRITIPVGVAYGTDPQQVLNLLKKLAEAHPSVLLDPEPKAFFMGFGESSLDFTLRVWVASFEVGFEARSDLAVAMDAALKTAGIHIPFPQRDLHLRSPAALSVKAETEVQRSEEYAEMNHVKKD
jgi:small-conductance mechanosensitive channel